MSEVIPKSLDTLFLGEAKDSVEDEVSPSLPDQRQKIGRSISFGDVFVKNRISEKSSRHDHSDAPVNSKDDSAIPSTGSFAMKGSGGSLKASAESGDKGNESETGSEVTSPTNSRKQLGPPPSLTLPEPSDREKAHGGKRGSGGALPSLDFTSSAPVLSKHAQSDRSPSKTERERVKKVRSMLHFLHSSSILLSFSALPRLQLVEDLGW